MAFDIERPGSPELNAVCPASTRKLWLSVIKVRPEQPQDEAFLFELYASTRQEELDAWGWPSEMRSAFLALQFKASQGHHHAFPDAEFKIVLLDGVNAGRLIINRTREELRVVDISLLPQFRNSGLGSALLQRIFGEAAASKKPLRLKVLRRNRAARLYQRLGFVKTSDSEMYLEMEWRAPADSPGR
jgi:ribosomal protein S18 acetylase RimI-like enzyme